MVGCESGFKTDQKHQCIDTDLDGAEMTFAFQIFEDESVKGHALNEHYDM